MDFHLIEKPSRSVNIIALAPWIICLSLPTAFVCPELQLVYFDLGWLG